MTGADLQVLLASVLAGETIDPTYALQLFNVSRLGFEGTREWAVLKAKDTSQTAQAGTNPTTALAMPSPGTPSLTQPYLMNYLREGTIQLVNSANANDIMVLKEVAYEEQLLYKSRPFFYADYPNRQLFVLASLPHSYAVWQFFVADFGDITNATQWAGFPGRFHPMLAFDAAARYRLGTDYDDIAARNADENFRTAQAMLKAATAWDARIAQQQANNRDLGARYGGAGYGIPDDRGGPYGWLPQ